MQPTDGDLTPDERFRETCLPEDRRRQVAAILAAGVLRLKTRPESAPDSADSGPKNGPEKLSDSTKE